MAKIPPAFRENILKKKKKKLPFHGKVAGGNARRRPDRKAFQAGGGISSIRRKPVPGEKREPPPFGPTEGLRRGGAVASKADADLINPNEPNAPAGGKVVKRQEGGAIPPGLRTRQAPRERPALPTARERLALPKEIELERPSVREIEMKAPKVEEVGPPQRKRGGIAKRQDGGDVKDQTSDQAKDGEEDEGVPEFKRGGRISAAQRRALPSSSFALPGKGKGPEGKGAGSYPIDTPRRARNALARGAQHASPEKLATIKRKVKAKYPGIEVSK
jgi:hypothetical protein